jgi:hypothetical protein
LIEKKAFVSKERAVRFMTWLGKAGFFSAAVVVVTVLAWFTGTNHCLLGLMGRPQNGACLVSHCPEHAKKSSDAGQGPSGMLACCQGLQSANFVAAKTKIAFIPFLVGIQLFAVRDVFLPEAPQSILLNMEYDTGPPASNSFVATVLKRSLRENAPPLV